MAAITPRLLPDTYNLAIRATTAIAAISAQPGHPVTWLRHATPTQALRTKVGWDFSDGFNPKVPFKEAGNARVGTIALGNYATGALAAAALQAAMNGAPGAVNTYTVTYDGGTGKTTIARATGAAAFELSWATAAAGDVAASCGKDYGFDVSADDTGATSYTSDLAAYQSRRWIKFDFGSAQAYTVGLLRYHNLSAGAVVKLQGNATALVAAGAAAANEQVLVGNARQRILFFASQSYRHVRILVDDVQNVAGYLQLGVPYVGTSWEPSGTSVAGIALGYTEVAVGLTSIERAALGAIRKTKRATAEGKPQLYTVTFVALNRADKIAFKAIEDADPHIFLARDPLNFPVEDTFYGVLEGPARLEQLRVPKEFYMVRFTFGEDLG